MRPTLPLVALALLVATFPVTPAVADEDNQFRASIIRCGDAFTASGCGLNVPSDPLKSGTLRVDEHGWVRIIIRGAAPSATYDVFVGVFTNDVPAFHFQFPAVFTPIGTFMTDARGNFSGILRTSTGEKFAFPVGTEIVGAHFAINNRAGVGTAFATGLRVTGPSDD